MLRINKSNLICLLKWWMSNWKGKKRTHMQRERVSVSEYRYSRLARARLNLRRNNRFRPLLIETVASLNGTENRDKMARTERMQIANKRKKSFVIRSNLWPLPQRIYSQFECSWTHFPSLVDIRCAICSERGEEKLSMYLSVFLLFVDSMHNYFDFFRRPCTNIKIQRFICIKLSCSRRNHFGGNRVQFVRVSCICVRSKQQALFQRLTHTRTHTATKCQPAEHWANRVRACLRFSDIRVYVCALYFHALYFSVFL